MTEKNEYYSEEKHGPHEYFELGDFSLVSDEVLLGARIAYKTAGILNEAKDNAILSLTCGRARQLQWSRL